MVIAHNKCTLLRLNLFYTWQVLAGNTEIFKFYINQSDRKITTVIFKVIHRLVGLQATLFKKHNLCAQTLQLVKIMRADDKGCLISMGTHNIPDHFGIWWVKASGWLIK